jgi:hypothetical protein
MTQVLLIITLVVIGIPVVLYTFWMVHIGLDYLYVRHARRFCRQNGLKIRRIRMRPEFDSSGVKTECTEVQLDCVDAQQQRRLVLLAVWLFGIRKTVSNELYPESYESEWPEDSV